MIAGYNTYEEARRNFRWADRWKLLGAEPESFNLAVQCIDVPMRLGRSEDVAVRIVHSTGDIETLTFGELHQGSLRVAGWLSSRGIGRGTSILTTINPGLAWILLHFAAFRVGAPIVPASPILGLDSLRLRVAQSGARLAVTRHADEADEIGRTCEIGAIVERDIVDAALSVHTPNHAGIDAGGRDAAAFVFSSGTTGRPKRTTLSHRSFTFNAIGVGAFVLALNPSDRFVKVGATAWGGAINWGVAMPMLNGTAAGIYSGPLKPEVVVAAARKLALTALWCPPSGLRQVLKADTDELTIPKMAYAGESAGAELIDAVRRDLGATLRGHYGATEVGLVTLDYAYDDYALRPGSVGQAVIGLDVGVIGGDGQLVRHGEQGELAVRRRGTWYPTGDLGHRDEEGYYWLTGRRNDVIISGGYTIGPAEVEDCIRQYSGVSDVGVIGIPDAERGLVVKAFVELEPGVEPSAEMQSQIAEFVRERVGRYAYPRQIEFLEELPRGEGGKVQRARLREREGIIR